MSLRIRSASSRRLRRTASARHRAGMSLIEVIVALLILSGVLLALGGFTAKFAQASSQAHMIILANELAVKRLDEVRQQPNYLAILNMGTSPQNTRPRQADFMTFTESTYVTRTGGGVKDLVDYMTVTAVIKHKGMKKRITKTTAMAAF
jgi:prepilin-type N-terminal cleavage/methylation domain-containing protein